MNRAITFLKNINGIQKFNLTVACFCFIVMLGNFATGSLFMTLWMAVLSGLNIASMFANATK